MNFVKYFFCIYLHNYFFFSVVLMCWVTLFDVWMLKQPGIPGINPICSWCIILFKHCWTWFVNILMRICVCVCVWNSLVKSVPGDFYFRFEMTNTIYLVVIGLLRLTISSSLWFVIFFLGCQFCEHKIVCIISLLSF